MLETMFIQGLWVLIIIETVASLVPYFGGIKEVNPLTALLKKYISKQGVATVVSGMAVLWCASILYVLLKGGHWSLWLLLCIYYIGLIGWKMYLAEKS